MSVTTILKRTLSMQTLTIFSISFRFNLAFFDVVQQIALLAQRVIALLAQLRHWVAAH